MGYAFQAATNPGRAEAEMRQAEVMLTSMDEHFPHVAALGPLLTNCQWDKEYLFGLEIILDGIESRLN